MARTKRDMTRCRWVYDMNHDAWDTSCGMAFSLNDGTPIDHHMKFCCFCGLPLRQIAE